ncbi:hypothetical protein C9374_006032 [Naegleria lovaniensis]|uniref:GAIN-B domain-containing protein n=1 Tax=Naegleria lovaniensis TaxID=51637 RepID=A0AA88KJB5_NAELO|nr:uncharacterized protein C9374_006032 [Naegleria lovaniensis]KAG2381648.1 hypothetical protein C9374_006032 [Naegleria lovaniensis]
MRSSGHQQRSYPLGRSSWFTHHSITVTSNSHTHVPTRLSSEPSRFLQMMVMGCIQLVIFTSLYYSIPLVVEGATTTLTEASATPVVLYKLITVAGTRNLTYNGEDIPPLNTNINYPNFVFPVYPANTSLLDVYFTDRNRLRKIKTVGAPGRSVSTIAGNAVQGYSGEGPSWNASLNQPAGIYVSPNQDFILVSDVLNHRIRKIDLIEGRISTIIGGFNNSKGFNGDGFLGNETLIDTPQGVTMFNGEIYFVDSVNHRVRKLDSRTNRVQTVAGNGIGTYNGDGIKATLASLNTPIEIVFNSIGEMFITDALNSLIRKVDTNGFISTVAGNYGALLPVDGVPATQTALGAAKSIAFSPFSESQMFIADSFNCLIRKVNMKTGIITTVAGIFGFMGFSSDISDASEAVLDTPQSMFVDSLSGDIIFVERGNALIRKLSPYCSNSAYSLSYDFSSCYDSCYGVKLNDSRLDTCVCRSGFIGRDCSIPICVAILSGSDLSQNSTTTVECSKTIIKGSELNVHYLENLNDLNSRKISFNGFQNILVEFPSNVSMDLSRQGFNLNTTTNMVLVSSAYVHSQLTYNETSFKSPLISVSLLDKKGLPITISNLEKPIQLHFTTTPQQNLSTLICMYYHELEKVWKTDGVETTRLNGPSQVHITCSTTHLTSFAVIDSNFKKATNSDTKESTGLSPETQLAIALSVVGSVLVLGIIALIVGVVLTFYCRIRIMKKKGTTL